MNIESYRSYCLSLKGVTEDFPFDSETLVFKVMSKMFALTNVSSFTSINLKCDPEEAAELRETYDAVRPGYHMNKKHWNTVLIGTGALEGQLRELIDHSYELVRASLPKAVKATLEM